MVTDQCGDRFVPRLIVKAESASVRCLSGLELLKHLRAKRLRRHDGFDIAGTGSLRNSAEVERFHEFQARD